MACRGVLGCTSLHKTSQVCVKPLEFCCSHHENSECQQHAYEHTATPGASPEVLEESLVTCLSKSIGSNRTGLGAGVDCRDRPGKEG
ncbi:hypothetical protein CEXT_15881 [Caerostris extrusa]|uniref:Uncharacterized protein n=1 Tax=Caerostris extrusa TaxID=172846 RepID=A0AAV4UCP9_CAEEX|nr:hypothetical protein CEXT_15881 [Caerostris extrusa]